MRNARKGAPHPDADHDGVDDAAHLLKDLLRCGLFMELRIGRVFKLPRGETVGDFAAISLALEIAPCMPSASGVRITSAPSAPIILTFSSEKRSGTQRMTR